MVLSSAIIAAGGPNAGPQPQPLPLPLPYP